MFDRYRRVLRLPGVARLELLATLARVPVAASGLVLTLHVVGALGRSYAQAGLVATAVTVGGAIGAPWRGRAVDRWGLRAALLPSIGVEACVWGLAPEVGYTALIGLALVGGLLGLPIFSVVRQSLTVLVPEAQRRTALAFDSVTTELSFIIGPATIVVLATRYSTRLGMWTIGACLVAAGIALVVTNPPTRSAAEPGVVSVGAAGQSRHFLRNRSVLAILAVVATATMVLSGTDIGIVSTLREAQHTPFIAWAMAAWCTGSLVGGLIYGGLHRTVSPWLLLLGLAALTSMVGLARTPWQLAALLVPAGALCAPVITATVERITVLVPEHRRGEAMGWHGSALTVGSAMGSPATGAVIDAIAPWAGFVAIGAAGVLLALGRGVAGRLLPRRAHGAPEPVPAPAASHLPS